MIDTTSTEPVTLDGACHCGTVKFRATLSEGWASARRCNCSMCEKRGAVAVSSALEEFELIAGADKLATYQFNTNTAEHHFCVVCGIYTHHKRRSNPDQFGVNVACLKGVSPFDFAEIEVLNGRTHPKDTGEAWDRVAGTLRFEPKA